MRQVLWLVLVLVGGVSVDVQAQGHPCDTATPAAVATRTGFTVGACADGKDIDGVATTLTAIRVFIDGVLVRVAAPVAAGPANAAGLTYYTVTGVTASKGARELTVTVVSADGESDPSTVYTFSVVGAKPSKPHGARVEPR